MTAIGAVLTREEVEDFLYLEARLADESDYDAWEALWTDDAIYWVPAGRADADPHTSVSVIFDNRNRIATRLNQLRTGIIWLRDEHLARLLDPSADRWRDD